ncbi:MAG: hypothetical protein ACI9OJ_003584 [Myxococcota bacterium]
MKPGSTAVAEALNPDDTAGVWFRVRVVGGAGSLVLEDDAHTESNDGGGGLLAKAQADRQRYDTTVAAVAASKAKKSSGEIAALGERLEFSLDEGRDGLAIGVTAHAFQELSEMAANDVGNNARVGVAGRDIVRGIGVGIVHDPRPMQRLGRGGIPVGFSRL